MELMQQVKGNYCTERREEAEEEGAREIITPTREAETNSTRLQEEDGAAASNLRKHLDMMELSLGSNKEVEGGYEEGENGCLSMMMMMKEKKEEEEVVVVVEKEHMFDKVVTPSDVGKLNRLVIPKQHAEKYFPLDSSSNEKGLLLNFEDRNGKVWRFRYSYWNSSQSYVMTKGWSRFVKEKKLDAGDIVSFQRGLSDLYRHRLYIDWRPRHAPHLSHPHIPFFPCPTLPSTITHTHTHPRPHPPHRFHFHHHLNYNNIFTTFHQQHQQHYLYAHLNSGSAALPPPSLFSSSSMPSAPASDRAPIIIDSVPVAHHHHHHHHQHASPIVSGASATPNTGKRLRLFGVNMECASSAQGSEPSSSSSLPRFRDYEDRLPLSGRFGGQRGGRGFDLDPSLH